MKEEVRRDWAKIFDYGYQAFEESLGFTGRLGVDSLNNHRGDLIYIWLINLQLFNQKLQNDIETLQVITWSLFE